MKKFTKKVVAVIVSAVITVASAGMALGIDIYYYSKCPNCGKGVTVTEGRRNFTFKESCKHGYAERGVKDDVNYRARVIKQECVDQKYCGWYFDTTYDYEEMSRMCGLIRRMYEN
jgi:hypothetical protein